MRQAFHDKLDGLTDHGARMCQLTGDALHDATTALLTADLRLAEKVIATGSLLDDMRAAGEAAALEILVLQAPVATDLRRVITAFWIIADVQRMGVLATHVAKATRRRHPARVVPDQLRPIIERMGVLGAHLADQAVQVLRDWDVKLAGRMETTDDLMDDLHQQMFTALFSPTWAYGVEAAVDLSLLGRFYDRFADHAVAVAHRVGFLVTGENVTGHNPATHSPPGANSLPQG